MCSFRASQSALGYSKFTIRMRLVHRAPCRARHFPYYFGLSISCLCKLSGYRPVPPSDRCRLGCVKNSQMIRERIGGFFGGVRWPLSRNPGRRSFFYVRSVTQPGCRRDGLQAHEQAAAAAHVPSSCCRRFPGPMDVHLGRIRRHAAGGASILAHFPRLVRPGSRLFQALGTSKSQSTETARAQRLPGATPPPVCHCSAFVASPPARCPPFTPPPAPRPPVVLTSATPTPPVRPANHQSPPASPPPCEPPTPLTTPPTSTPPTPLCDRGTGVKHLVTDRHH